MNARWLLAGLLLAAVAQARPVAADVDHAWVRWLPDNLPAAGYATIRNPSAKPLGLLGADSPDYATVTLHHSLQSGGVERMEDVANLEIPAHASVALAPGGYHLMLMRPQHPIAPGDVVHVRLHFSDGQTLDVPFAVRPASSPDGG